MNYRKDIDGLRAVSVVLVMLFHYGATFISGGFVGVDVFFVISGYLITGILLEALRGGHFSVLWFYERRIRRIVPALLATVLLTLAAGWLLLSPGDYRDAANSSLAAIATFSNVFFYFNTGYFDQVAERMPALHTWSLGVEEQFYIVWPLLLAALYWLSRGRRRVLLLGMALVFALSFGFNLWQMAVDPKAAFFLPFSRAWELAAGALLTLLPRPALPRWLGEAMPALGVALIVWTALALTSASPFPGWNAAPPVLGAALVLYGGAPDALAARLLSTRPFVAIGKISYSLYLVHWPVIVLWRHYSGANQPTWTEFMGLAGLALALSTASYLFVEQPTRRSRRSRLAVYGLSGAASAAVASLAFVVAYTGGAPGRIPPAMAALGGLDVMWTWPCPEIAPVEVANYADPSKKTMLCGAGAPWGAARNRALLWGDSNAEHLMPLLDAAGRKEGTALALINPCPAILRKGGVERFWLNNPTYSEQCGKQRETALALLRERQDITTVILSARWSNLPGVLYRDAPEPRSEDSGRALLREGMSELLDAIGADKKVVLFLDIPQIPKADPVSCAMTKGSLLRRPCAEDLEALAWRQYNGNQRPSHDALRQAAEGRANVTVIDSGALLCANERCRTYLNGEFIYRDSVHFRRNLTEPTTSALVDLLHLDLAVRPPVRASASGQGG